MSSEISYAAYLELVEADCGPAARRRFIMWILDESGLDDVIDTDTMKPENEWDALFEKSES